MFTVFKVANVITATVGGGRFRVGACARVKTDNFRLHFCADALETEADAFGKVGAVFSIIRGALGSASYSGSRVMMSAGGEDVGPSRRSDKERGSTPVNYRQVLNSTQ